jgi:hypothetical protein
MTECIQPPRFFLTASNAHVRKWLRKLLDDYDRETGKPCNDPITECIRDGRWGGSWLIDGPQGSIEAWRQGHGEITFSVFDAEECTTIATGKTVLEACQRAIEQEKTT